MIDVSNINVSDEIAEILLNPEYKLLVDFKRKAPGTFVHSENVMHMIEKVGRALNLNINACKIIGMYHDIGKMNYPKFFCENQQKDFNINDMLDPYVSAVIIQSHVSHTSSILLSKCEEMPIELIKIMIQHHGDTVLKSIYSKIKNLERENNIEKYSEDDFKYKFGKPNNVYSCSLMICDSLEAMIRAKRRNENLKDENIPDIISNLLESLGNSMQIDELTIRQVRIIKDVLISEYSMTSNRIIEGYEEDKESK